MEIETTTIETGIPVIDNTGIEFLFDWKNNVDYEILKEMRSERSDHFFVNDISE